MGCLYPVYPVGPVIHWMENTIPLILTETPFQTTNSHSKQNRKENFTLDTWTSSTPEYLVYTHRILEFTLDTNPKDGYVPRLMKHLTP